MVQGITTMQGPGNSWGSYLPQFVQNPLQLRRRNHHVSYVRAGLSQGSTKRTAFNAQHLPLMSQQELHAIQQSQRLLANGEGAPSKASSRRFRQAELMGSEAPGQISTCSLSVLSCMDTEVRKGNMPHEANRWLFQKAHLVWTQSFALPGVASGTDSIGKSYANGRYTPRELSQHMKHHICRVVQWILGIV